MAPLALCSPETVVDAVDVAEEAEPATVVVSPTRPPPAVLVGHAGSGFIGCVGRVVNAVSAEREGFESRVVEECGG